MGRITIIGGKTFVLDVPDGTGMGDALSAAGITVGSCGGTGICGKCRVRLTEGGMDGINTDADGCFLLCRAVARGNATVAAAPGTVFIFTSDNDNGNGNGTKGTHKETPISPSHDPRVSPPLSSHHGNSMTIGVAVDVGTTTLEAEAFDLDTGCSLGISRRRDPLCIRGSDVMSRISAAETHLSDMTSALHKEINLLIRDLCGDDRPVRAVFAGNTVMSHILLGIDPSPLGVYPYTPSFTGSFRAAGDDIGIFADEILLIPCISAFIGGDITAGILATGLDDFLSHNSVHSENARYREKDGDPECSADSPKSVLFCDLGTNGELILASNGTLRATSAAAGPAFEGGGISCGTVWNPEYSSIEHVYVRGNGADSDISIVTSSDLPASGICGSGVIDAIAAMKTLGVINSDGDLASPCDLPPRLASRVIDLKFYLTDTVYISQKDVRIFQLAHSAIKTAAEILTGDEKPDKLILAGNFGATVYMDNLKRLRTLPDTSRSESAGNAALTGAGMVLRSPDLLLRTEDIVRLVDTVELTARPEFNERFISNLRL